MSTSLSTGAPVSAAGRTVAFPPSLAASSGAMSGRRTPPDVTILSWTQAALEALRQTVARSPNFKVRIAAAQAIATLPSRRIAGLAYGPLLTSLAELLRSLDHATDFTEFRYKPQLEALVRRALVRLLSLATLDDGRRVAKVLLPPASLQAPHHAEEVLGALRTALGTTHDRVVRWIAAHPSVAPSVSRDAPDGRDEGGGSGSGSGRGTSATRRERESRVEMGGEGSKKEAEVPPPLLPVLVRCVRDEVYRVTGGLAADGSRPLLEVRLSSGSATMAAVQGLVRLTRGLCDE